MSAAPTSSDLSAERSPSGRNLSGRKSALALKQTAERWSLSKAQTGRLFGISRQAVDEWYAKGVPPARVADVLRTADLADALHKRFLPDRLPQIVREAMPGLGNTSIIETIERHGTVAVFEMLDRAFGYTP